MGLEASCAVKRVWYPLYKRVWHPLSKVGMKHLRIGEVARVTGLTRHQVREWTERRKLVKPAVWASGTGTRNLFTWREVLALRVAATLRSKFGVDLEVVRPFFLWLQRHLEGVSFLSLWDRTIFINNGSDFAIGEEISPNIKDAMFVIPLNGYLEAIVNDMLEEASPKQLSLPLLSVRK